MIFFLISFVAGLLTILAPCVLPLLPIIVGTSDGETKGLSRRSIVVITSLSLSVFIFTLALKATALFIMIPPSFWTGFSGIVLILVGLAMMYPDIWSRIPFVRTLSVQSNKALAAGHQKQNIWGDVVTGVALGPVFSTCSPTYLFIIATVLPATLLTGLWYLFGFILGLAISLSLIAFFGNYLVGLLVGKTGTVEWVKWVFGVLIIIVGIGVVTGYDKKLETYILDSGYGATINFEEGLINRFGGDEMLEMRNEDVDKNPISRVSETDNVAVPLHLRGAFSSTDWTRVDSSISSALSGGPGKDGIPAIDNPKFEGVEDFKHADDIQAIVIESGDGIKVYPYNILVWHEIVNDTAGDTNVAVTFCPLCGSAIVYDRQDTTFGVSGSLLESNMIMYDRSTESLWQQSTGVALAGDRLGEVLDLVSFQLLTMGEVKEKYPSAQVLSEDTGHFRDYSRYPYGSYDTTDSFIFRPSFEDERYSPKEIFVIYNVDGVSHATPRTSLEDGKLYTINSGATLQRVDGEIEIMKDGAKIPFYFEMWFSWIVQHSEDGVVFDPEK